MVIGFCRFVSILFIFISFNFVHADYPWEISRHRAILQLNKITENIPLKFGSLYTVRIRRNTEVKNAFCIGNVITITEPLMTALSDSELLAVIAHEVAHGEKVHQVKRIGAIVGGAFPSIYHWNQDMTFMERYAWYNENVNGDHEIEADCLAYNWLSILNVLGYSVEPQDLNRATNALYDMDLANFDVPELQDFIPLIRYKNIERGYGLHCD